MGCPLRKGYIQTFILTFKRKLHIHSNSFPRPGGPISYTHTQALEGYDTGDYGGGGQSENFPMVRPHKDTLGSQALGTVAVEPSSRLLNQEKQHDSCSGHKARDCLLSRDDAPQVLMEHFSQLHRGHGSEFSKTIC